LRGVEAVQADFGHFGGAFIGAGLGEFGGGEDFFAEAPALEVEAEGILFEEEVEYGHLADLRWTVLVI
ncbi:hypothetical protein LTS18_014274, partial [Coniosporium uncinatum]